MISAGVLGVCATHFIALNKDPVVVLDTLTTLTQIIHYVPCFVDMIVETEEISKLVESIPLILFDEGKWKVLMNFFVALRGTPSGVEWILRNRILDTLHSFQFYKEQDTGLASLIQMLETNDNSVLSDISASLMQSSRSQESAQQQQQQTQQQQQQPLQGKQKLNVPLSWSEGSQLVLDASQVNWSAQESFISFCAHCLVDESMSHYIAPIISVLEEILNNERRTRGVS